MGIATPKSQQQQQLMDQDGSDVDADAEETADEAPYPTNGGPRKKRRLRRPKPFFSDSLPGTPRISFAPGSPGSRRLPGMRRRATMPDSADRGAVSEGEGRDQLRRPQARRGNSHLGSNSRDADDADDVESPPGRRIAHFRRISVWGGGEGGGGSDGDALAIPRRPRFVANRASTFGVQRWRQVKNTLGLLRQRRGEGVQFNKSAELMAELRAGAPAAVMLASMLLRDEHGNKRIPVLLEQVRIAIADSTPVQSGNERHTLFTIRLEYGNGPNRMIWTVKRTIREILNLHLKYKLALSNERLRGGGVDIAGRSRQKQPHFPYGAFPYLRGVRGAGAASDDDDAASIKANENGTNENDPHEATVNETVGEATAGEMTAGEATAAEGTATEAEGRPSMKKRGKSRLGLGSPRHTTSGLDDAHGLVLDHQAQAAAEAAQTKRKYVDKQRRTLEKYLQDMIKFVMFRADSNRICRFLELSALGVRLALEGGYHGKECYLHIQSAKGLDFRRVLTPGKVIARHSRKWFLVRQSYIVCVESPENIDIYDVYLVDPTFKIISKKSRLRQIGSVRPKKSSKKKAKNQEDVDLIEDSKPDAHHTLTILTSERKVKLWSGNQHLIRQFEESIKQMLSRTPWVQNNRFESFAPVRTRVFAQWLVDGRDYMWNVSRAISMAKDVIYIHDWWLSPELYMRRPPCISQKWRLDRLLQRKAREGVKVFIIVYRNVEAAIPIDSEYTKYALLNLHPNIFVQRSPNQFKKNQFFFAHHEKICIVDHHIAFVGGIDLCFGRWDNPQHPLSDDKPTGFEPLEEQNAPKDAEHCQLFPGKDYSNPRVQDFFKLRDPYEEMYDRSKTPRMPWHDVAMQVVGQPARDLTRHFVQRWNYVRRGRKPTRPLPFLLPPPDFPPQDLEALGLTGTCDVQILRSASLWSLGTEHTEHSIQTAYVHMIEHSDHFVYMENQFFITSTEALGVKIVNRIGDALVSRIMRAHQNDEDWRCVVIIPLMPGFQSSVAEQDGTSVRLILQCQYRSICRGEDSIFGRLRAEGIEPEDYIQFFSLRQWGKIGDNLLTSEQLYIHAKIIIVDDRIALIGSANINERSMLGSRDSETAAIVRDDDLLWSTMAGRPYQVGRFAHTLRLRLMREHLGLPVDEIVEEERQAELDRQEADGDFESEMDHIYSGEHLDEPVPGNSKEPQINGDLQNERPPYDRNHRTSRDLDHAEMDETPKSTPRDSKQSKGKSTDASTDTQLAKDPELKREAEAMGTGHWMATKEDLDEGRGSIVMNGRESLDHSVLAQGKGTNDSPRKPHSLSLRPLVSQATTQHDGPRNGAVPPMPPMDRRRTEQLGLPRAYQLPDLPLADDADIGGPPLHFDANGKPVVETTKNPLAADIDRPKVHKDSMRDPLNPSFYDDIWSRVAENNTKLFRRVFRVLPDNEVAEWPEYEAYVAYQMAWRDRHDNKTAGKSEGLDHKPETEKSEPEQRLQQVAAGGAGIGAPGPVPVMRALTQLSGLVGRESDEKPLPPLPGKQEEESAPHRHARQDSRLDVEKLAAAQRALNTPRTSPKTNPLESNVLATVQGQEPSDPTHLAPTSEKMGRRATFSTPDKPEPPPRSSGGQSTSEKAQNNVGSVKRRRRATTRGSRRGQELELISEADAEELCGMIQGHLVQFPYDFLMKAEERGNWLYQVDQVAPLQIYN